MKAFSLESALEHPALVRELYIRNRGLRALPAALADLKRLQVLGLADNQLVHFQWEGTGLDELEVLDLSNNQLSDFPPSLRRLKKLRVLNLSGNRLQQLPDWLGECSHLESLNLSDNELEALPDSIGALCRCRTWNLANNRLRKLPPSLERLVHLRSVDLSGNRLSRLPVAFCRLPSIQILSLSGNKVKTLPPETACWPALEQLFWKGNGLPQVPDALRQCTRLQQLDLSRNRLKTLPTFFSGFWQLRHLDLSQNQLPALPADLFLRMRLRQLALAGNLLTHLPEAIRTQDQLRILDLRQNHLAHLPEWVDALSCLETFQLDGNALESLPEALMRMEKLERLSMKGHRLQSVPELLFALPQLKDLVGWKQGKKMLSFARACVEAGIPANRRRALWQWTYDRGAPEPSLDLETAFEGLRHAFPTVRKACQAFLTDRTSAREDLQPGEGVAFLGAFPPALRAWEKKLDALGIPHGRGVGPTTHWVVLGQKPAYDPGLARQGVIFLSIPDWQHWLQKGHPGFLTALPAGGSHEKISRLLTSGQAGNAQLAIRFLEKGGVPPFLHTALYLAYHQLDDPAIKRQLMGLMRRHFSEKEQKVLDARPEQVPAERLETYFSQMLEGTAFDPDALIRFWAARH